MPKLKPGTIVPTPEEDKRINAGIASDPDAGELDDAWFAKAKPAKEFFDAKTYNALGAMKRKPGERGPQKAPLKERITIRLSPEVLEQFRATGAGWQTRVDVALADWLKVHKPEEISTSVGKNR